MIKGKQFLLLLNILYIFAAVSLSAQTFYQVDIERMLKNHPIARQYDPVSGRFKGTESEVMDQHALTTRLGSVSERIENLNNQKLTILESIDAGALNSTSEENLWAEIGSIDQEIAKLSAELQRLQQLVPLSGKPPISTVHQVINSIYEDVKNEYNSEISAEGDVVILNEFPGYVTEIPDINQPHEGLLRFLHSQETAALEEYLQYNYQIGMLFKSVTKPVVYQRSHNE